MAKFGTPDPDAEPTPPVERFVPKTEAVVTATSTTTFTSSSSPSPSFSPSSSMGAQPQVAAQAQVIQAEAQAAMDQKVLEAQLAKQDEHWMKAYWRPAMGWLYMLICFCDFVAFPVISMFLPVMIKGLPYVAWKSITLDNGGLIHLAFGAILGVTAYGRTQEKVQSKQ